MYFVRYVRPHFRQQYVGFTLVVAAMASSFKSLGIQYRFGNIIRKSTKKIGTISMDNAFHFQFSLMGGDTDFVEVKNSYLRFEEVCVLT